MFSKKIFRMFSLVFVLSTHHCVSDGTQEALLSHAQSRQSYRGQARFTATQLLEVSQNGESHPLLAQLRQGKSDLLVIFYDLISFSPMLRVQESDGVIHQENLAAINFPPELAQNVVMGIHLIFASQETFFYDQEKEISSIGVTISEQINEGKCTYPKVIRFDFKERKVQLKITQQSFHCGEDIRGT